MQKDGVNSIVKRFVNWHMQEFRDQQL